MKTIDTVKNLTNGVLGTTKQFYLAGLGVAVTVGDHSKKAFDQLVEKGEKAGAKTEGETEKTGLVDDLTGRVKGFGEKAGNRIQEGITGTLGRLGIPSRDEIQALTQSVEQLTEKVKSLQAEKVA